MSMRRAERAFFGSMLKSLGYKAPSEEDLNNAIRKAFAEVKQSEGLNPDDVKYRFELIPVDRDWVDQTFSQK